MVKVGKFTFHLTCPDWNAKTFQTGQRCNLNIYEHVYEKFLINTSTRYHLQKN